MTSTLPSQDVKTVTSKQHLRPPFSGLELDPFYSGLELDPFYSGLELDRNVSGLEPVSVDYGPEPTPAECQRQNAPQVLIRTEEKEAVELEIPAGLIVQDPTEDQPINKASHRLMAALVLFVILIAIVVPVSVTQTRNKSR